MTPRPTRSGTTSCPPSTAGYLARIPGLSHLDVNRGFDDGVRDALLKVLYQSGSELCLLPFQDLLGAREQVNVPGTVDGGNWIYRMPMTVDDLLADHATCDRLRHLATESQRFLG